MIRTVAYEVVEKSFGMRKADKIPDVGVMKYRNVFKRNKRVLVLYAAVVQW